MIEDMESAVASFAWRASYRLWPSPKRNTFVAWVARQGLALRLDLPPHGDRRRLSWLATFLDHAPSGTVWQVSLVGLAGVTVARDEGLELNVLGFSFDIDFYNWSLRLPGFGRLLWNRPDSKRVFK